MEAGAAEPRGRTAREERVETADWDTILARHERSAITYEMLANIYSLGMIKASKNSQIESILPGDTVLCVGVGTCEYAIGAAQAGAIVTCIDPVPAMIEIAKRKFSEAGLEGQFICGDVREHVAEDGYDIVTANYYLNDFAQPTMLEVFRHLASLLRPGGQLMIADFVAPSRNPIVYGIQQLNNFVPMASFVLAGKITMHKLEDYTEYFDEAGLVHADVTYFRLFGKGPILYGSVTGERARTASHPREAENSA